MFLVARSMPHTLGPERSDFVGSCEWMISHAGFHSLAIADTSLQPLSKRRRILGLNPSRLGIAASSTFKKQKRRGCFQHPAVELLHCCDGNPGNRESPADGADQFTAIFRGLIASCFGSETRR